MPNPRPRLRIIVERPRQGDEFVDMGLLCERAVRNVPEGFTRRIEKLQAPVGAENRNAFLEAVERLALGADERVVLPLEREPLGLVREEVGDAPVGAFFRQQLHRAPVG